MPSAGRTVPLRAATFLAVGLALTRLTACDAFDAAPPEAHTGDAGGEDAAPSSDGATAAFDASDGASLAAWCASRVPTPSFCDDFESPSWRSNWHSVVVADGGLLERVVVSDRGDTHALGASLAGSTTLSGAYAERKLPRLLATVDCAFDVAVDSIAANGWSGSLFIVTWSGPIFRRLQIDLRSPTALHAVDRDFSPDGGTAANTIGSPLPVGAFRNLRLVITNEPSLTLYEDGVSFAKYPLTYGPPPSATETKIALGLVDTLSSSASPSVRFDNVACTFD